MRQRRTVEAERVAAKRRGEGVGVECDAEGGGLGYGAGGEGGGFDDWGEIKLEGFIGEESGAETGDCIPIAVR